MKLRRVFSPLIIALLIIAPLACGETIYVLPEPMGESGSESDSETDHDDSDDEEEQEDEDDSETESGDDTESD